MCKLFNIFKVHKFSKFILLLFSILIILILNGCSSANNNTDTNTDANIGNNRDTQKNTDKISLTLWHYYNGSTKDMLDNMIIEFNETVGASKNIIVDAYSYSNVSDLASALVASANKEVGVEDMPDIFSAYNDTALLLDQLGTVASMDSYFTEEELLLFRNDFLEEGRFDAEGNLKILPVAKSTELVFLNNTDFEIFSNDTGVELSQLSTWESMLEVAELYYNWTDAKTEEEHDGRALFGIDSEANFIIIASEQLGEQIYKYDNSGNIIFGLSEEGARKIWEIYMTPYIKGYYVSQGSFRSDDVKSGDILMYAGSTSSVNYFPLSVELSRIDSYNIEGITIPYPYFEDGKKLVVQQGAGMLITKSNATSEAASAEFLKWFTSPENNLEFAVSTGYIPVQNEALSYENVLDFIDENLQDEEISDTLLSSIDTIYNKILPEYEFYLNKPFNGSYDTRDMIKNHVVDPLLVATSELENQISLGREREEVIESLTNEESFKKWYSEFKNDIDNILDNNN